MKTELLYKIENSEKLSLTDSFDLAQHCSLLLRDEKKAHNGRKILIQILDKNLENNNFLPDSTKELWADIMEFAGFYPYLEKEKKHFELVSNSSSIRKEFHRSNNIEDIYFHEEQKNISSLIDSNKSLILSAPTSFGKSLLIEDIVASKKFKNIVVIQPTLALLDETRKKLRKYKDSYKIIIRTSQEPSDKLNNLYLFTAERVMEYIHFKKIDFFVIDEFYKVSAIRGDERADTLNNAFHFLLHEYKCKFYLLGPNIDGISKGFQEKYNAIFYQTNYSLIDNKVIDMFTANKEILEKASHHKKSGYSEALEKKEKLLFDLLLELNLKNEQTLIYCSSPGRVRNLSTKFCSYLISNDYIGKNNVPLIDWIDENIDSRWTLYDSLRFNIGIHDGTLQKHITTSVIKYFNENILKYLFCTSTIIEGVNTSAKNVIIYDNWKAQKKKENYIDFFDYSNIKGRAGRMMVHYIGKIYNFNMPPNKDNTFIIDIPFFEQNQDKGHIKPEMLIHLENNEIKDKTTKEYQELNSINDKEKLLFKNNGVIIKGQQSILLEISNLDKIIIIKNKSYRILELLIWNKNTPTYDQLQFILKLAWENLRAPKEQSNQMTLNRLVKMTWDYTYSKNLFSLIDSDIKWRTNQQVNKNKNSNEIYNDAVQGIFQISKHWFSYKVPKWISVINNLQQYILEKNNIKPKSYIFYASQLENDFMPENLTILSEYGIPKSAISKLEKFINSDMPENVVSKIAQEYASNKNSELIQYERDVIKEVL